MSNLPPVRHLPHWTRVGRLRKLRSPRPLPAEQLQPLPVVPPAGGGAAPAAAEEPRAGGSDPRAGGSDPRAGGSDPRAGGSDPRIESLQRNLEFVQQQHHDTLVKLHAEIENLRRENKELQYKLIMDLPKPTRKGLTHGWRDVRASTQDRDAHCGLHLEETLQDTPPSQDQAASIGGSSEAGGWSRQQSDGAEMTGRLITSLQPLRIHSSPSRPPRPPTLQECEVIIRQLYNANNLQSQEIIRVKALLRDIVLSKKVTPEHYILTKSYLVDGACTSLEDQKFPKIGFPLLPDKTSAPSQSGVVLPALKPSLSSTIAERQRRTRAVQRNRFKRTVH